jgi:hypothetical protein
VGIGLTHQIVDLVEQLSRDPWRELNPFSTDVQECNQTLFDPALSRADKAVALNSWLSDSQPCLFGRHAAKNDWLTFCLLNEADLLRGDAHVQSVIQAQRERWKIDARLGKKHGFIILVVSEAIANAKPSPALFTICQRLCQLYLSRFESEIPLLDEVALSINLENEGTETRLWKVGVNWFGAQADQRWWHDHRIPGGVGLSMNSVGHMARRLAEEALRDPKYVGLGNSIERQQLVGWALPVAMRTILKASEGQLAGTRLKQREATQLPEGITEEQRNKALGRALCPFSEDEYFGWYDTDATILPEYFDTTPKCPRETEIVLPFTYLHRGSDLDYLTMGLGEIIQREVGLAGVDSPDPVE